MQLTLEEREREAYRDGNADLANAIGKVIDLEKERLRLRDLLRDAIDTLGHCLPVIDAHRRVSGGDGDLAAMNARDVIERAAAAIEDEC